MAASTRSLSWKMFAMACVVLAVGVAVVAADPDPLRDYCVADLSPNAPEMNGYPCKPRSQVNASDFVYTGFRQPPGDVTEAVTGTVALVSTVELYPGLNTQGITHARLDFDVGGVLPLHTHPRATETLYVVKGSVYTGFVTEDDTLMAARLEEGDVIVFPKGLLHFQLNVGKGRAQTFNSFNSQSPGFLTTVNQIFMPNITSAVIEKSFGIDAQTLKKLEESYPR